MGHTVIYRVIQSPIKQTGPVWGANPGSSSYETMITVEWCMIHDHESKFASEIKMFMVNLFFTRRNKVHRIVRSFKTRFSFQMF